MLSQMSNFFAPFRVQHMFHTHINISDSDTIREQALRQKYWRPFIQVMPT